MSSDDQITATVLPPESRHGAVDRTGRERLSRRGFLAGIGLGSLGGIGSVVGLTQTDMRAQSLATLAGMATHPSGTQYHLPAADSSDSGLVVGIDLEFADGNGELFVNLTGVEVRHDIQLALREAMQTAADLTDRSFADTTTHVTFQTPDSDILTLRGKSWEAGITVALVASLHQQPLPSSTLITGVVSDEGTLLPVGEIEEKARAAREFGATELLVPGTRATDVDVQGLRITAVQSISGALDRIF